MRLFFLLFALLPLAALSQSARFRQIRIKPLPEKYNVDSATIVYPIIITDNKITAEKINLFVRKRIADPYTEDSSLVIDSALQYAKEGGLTELEYEIIFNKNGILSFILRLGGIGAYPTWWKETMNFDLATGKEITLKEIFIPGKFEGFKKQVFKDKISALTKYKKELKQRLDQKEMEKDIYDWALSEINEVCLKAVSLEKFIMSKTAVQIFDECEFPHAILALGPAYDLKYNWARLKLLIKPKIYKQLTR